MKRVPFNKPEMLGREIAYVQEAVRKGNLADDGAFTARCTRFIEKRCGVHCALMTSSCTAALEIAAALADIGPGDEVVLPSFSYVSTANAIARFGAQPVFVDIRRDTLNLDEEQVETAVTERTRAILPIHYGGVCSEMDRLREIANRHNLMLIEDAAGAFDSEYRGSAAGSMGALGCFSFHETKNMTCGQGGALCVNDAKYVERAQNLRDRGVNRKAYCAGRAAAYVWVEKGSAYSLSELSAAFLWGQIECLNVIRVRRARIFRRYSEELSQLAEDGRLQLPHIPPECQTNHHQFHILLTDHAEQKALLNYLSRRNITAVFHYMPLHNSPMGRKVGRAAGDLDNTVLVSERIVRLPFFNGLQEEGQMRVISEIKKFFKS